MSVLNRSIIPPVKLHIPFDESICLWELALGSDWYPSCVSAPELEKSKEMKMRASVEILDDM